MLINRVSEMYSWIERSKSVKKSDGTKTRSYYYEGRWKESPSNSDSFQSKSYKNPDKKIKNSVFSVESIQVRDYHIESRNLEGLNLPPLELSKDMIKSNSNQIDNYYLYKSQQFFHLKPCHLLPEQCTHFSHVLPILQLQRHRY